jgi:ubiquitin thioesterase CYLD
VPQKLLIQVPRYGKQFKTFQRIVPDKCLHIKELCTREGLLSCSGEMTAHLQLLSVLCIETSHYVCFTRSEDKWIFMDSMADRVDDCYNIPSCVDCTEELEGWVYSEKHRKDLKKQPAKKLPEFVRRFTQDVYMCVYVEDSTYV